MTRIIAGSAKGRRLATPKGERTRPTSDRVREALFSSLVHLFGDLDGLSVLDLYSGSGALALEAASRGAHPVTAVESNKATAELIRSNAKATALALTVRAARVESVVAAKGTQFDVVFADPPYDLSNEALAKVLADLVTNGWLGPESVIVVERATRSGVPNWPSEVAEVWSRRYGETTLHFGCFDAEET